MAVKSLNTRCTLNEFLEMEKVSDIPLEYIDGYVFAKSFSSIKHNKIVTRINARIYDYLVAKPCDVFSEQIEVILGDDRVKPDIFVICRKENESYKRLGQSFLEIPSIIFEVISPSNASLDTVIKMELYSNAGIREYNLVYQEGSIQQYRLNEFGFYYLANSFRSDEFYKSIVFKDLEIDLKKVFNSLDF